MKKRNLFRLFTLALALVMLVAVVACTNEGDATPTTAGQTDAVTTPGATTAKATTAKATTAKTTAATTVATTAATTAAQVDPNAPSVYSGSPDTSWFDKDNPKTEYTLTTADQFVGMAKLRQDSKGAITFEGITIKLGKDMIINAGTAEQYLAGGTIREVPAIGSSYKFKGTFDGQNHTVNGVYINATSSCVRGLFGGLGDNAVIKNLKLTNAYFDGPEKAKHTAGILAARANGTNILIANVTIENATMKQSTAECVGIGIMIGKIDTNATVTIENCSTSGTIDFYSVRDEAYGYGGLVGYTHKSCTLTIKNCTSSATVKGPTYCGGLLGFQEETSTVTIEGSTFTGTLIPTDVNAFTGNQIGGKGAWPEGWG